MSIVDSRPTVTVAAIVRQTFAVLRRRAPAISALAALLIGAPRAAALAAPQDRGGIALGSAVLTLLLVAALAHITAGELVGQPVSGRSAFEAGASRIGSLLLLALLSGLAEFGATALLVAPGVFLFVCWMPASAVCVLEKRPAAASLGRAWRLTAGHRWTLTAVTVLFLVGAIALVLGGAIGGVVMLEADDRELPGRIVSSLLIGLAYAVVYSVAGVGGAVAYVLLRFAKEGPPTARVAAVFD